MLGRVFLVAVLGLSSPAICHEVHWYWASPSRIQGAEPLSNGHILISEKDLGRVIEVIPSFPSGGPIVWQVNGLNGPDRTRRLPTGNTLIADTGNDQVIEVDPAGQVVWSFGTVGVVACVDTSVGQPGDMERLPNGDTLMADENQGRLLQVNAAGIRDWYFGRSDCAVGTGQAELNKPFSVQVLPGGDVLIGEVANHRVRRLHPTPPLGGTTVWQYGQDGIPGSGLNSLSQPVRALALTNGNVLITEAVNQRVIEVQPTPPSGGNIVWQYGTTGVAGAALDFLNAPYDAHRLDTGETLIAERDSQRVQLIAPDGSPAQLAISSPAIMAAPTNRCEGPIVVELQNLNGQPVAASIDLALSAGEPTGTVQFFLDSQCQTPASGIPLLGGTATGTFYLTGTQALQEVLTVSGPWLRPASQALELQNSRAFTVGCGCSEGAGRAEWLGLALLVACRTAMAARRRPG